MSKKTIWDGLRKRGLSEEVTAAIMGNMEAESDFISNRVQGDFTNGYTRSAEYTAQVDKGIISREDFIYHGPSGGGYGLLQWTFWSRKAGLYDFAKKRGTSIGDEDMQLDYLLTEGEWKAIKAKMNTLSIEEGAKLFMKENERPADTSQSAQNYRASLAVSIYNEMKEKPAGRCVSVPEAEYKRLTTAATIVDLMLNIKELTEEYSNADFT